MSTTCSSFCAGFVITSHATPATHTRAGDASPTPSADGYHGDTGEHHRDHSPTTTTTTATTGRPPRADCRKRRRDGNGDDGAARRRRRGGNARVSLRATRTRTASPTATTQCLTLASGQGDGARRSTRGRTPRAAARWRGCAADFRAACRRACRQLFVGSELDAYRRAATALRCARRRSRCGPTPARASTSAGHVYLVERRRECVRERLTTPSTLNDLCLGVAVTSAPGRACRVA
jgi:hypothetical protein